MARIGIISDIHGNLTALEHVLAALEAAQVDRIVCLGDIVGYNAEANECVARLQDQSIQAIAGNHDLIAVGRLGFERCADRPAFALRRTRKDLHARTRAALEALPPRLVIDARALAIHGGIDDVCQYMRSASAVLENRARMAHTHPDARICFFGHTHDQAVWELTKGSLVRRDSCEAVKLGDSSHTYFINPGSVDASRKVGKLAEFAIYDGGDDSVRFHRMPYDDSLVERRARECGYRMTRADELLYAAARILRRGKARARRCIGLPRRRDSSD